MQYVLSGNSYLEAHFEKIIAPQPKCFVVLKSNQQAVATFEMKQDTFERWQIVEPAPHWVGSLLSQLTAALRQSLN